jgi:hypothetical protein
VERYAEAERRSMAALQPAEARRGFRIDSKGPK